MRVLCKAGLKTKVEDYIGKKFYFLTILEHESTKRSPGGKPYNKVVVRCDCGKIKTVTLEDIIKSSRSLKSCGHIVIENMRKIGKSCRKSPGYSGFKCVIRMYKYKAKARGQVFEFSEENFKEIIFKNCFYCGSKPNAYTYSNSQRTAEGLENSKFGPHHGINRIDNSVGYTKSNCVTCCTNCNWAKSRLTTEEFKNLIKNIYNNWASKCDDM